MPKKWTYSTEKAKSNTVGFLVLLLCKQLQKKQERKTASQIWKQNFGLNM